ncbi:MAG: sn-glycerol-3-phosphate ABC transporter ATP-binding protein UgpC [Candidatus Coatesbacteria bacterium]|nr:sn-glycerol-3-phosphate ABC transporter ATP-binding protein UgpC [Candidatus Coatesbacteria bacterium]
MARVIFKQVNKTFPNGKEVLKNIDLEINDGEFFVLVGPSGCGKSTTLRLISGLDEPTKGEIYLDEVLVNPLPPKDRDIAMVFQNYALYPHMSIRENLAFGLKIKKKPKDEIELAVKKTAELLGIEELLDRKPRQLSGGQNQRVAVGRAVIRQPRVFLFDEPLSNLDAKLRGQMRIELKRIHNRLKTTMIYVTHDQIEAMTLGERICILNKGEIQQTDTPMNVYQRPANTFVAQFIGSPPMNILKEYSKIDDKIIKFSCEIPKGAHQLGFRPEDTLWEREGTGLHLTANLEGIETIGREAIYHFNFIESKMQIKKDFNPEIIEGNDYWLFIPEDNIHWFDDKDIRI